MSWTTAIDSTAVALTSDNFRTVDLYSFRSQRTGRRWDRLRWNGTYTADKITPVEEL